MTIFWDLILKTEEVCGELERMYSQLSLGALAEHLGVSKDSLRKKLIQCNIPIRTRGGSYPRIPRDDLPVDAYKMDVAQLASHTGYTIQYCRKLRAKLRREICHKTKTQESQSQKSKGGKTEPKNSKP